jgi:DNA-nicking Smr family endonuclease
MPQKSRITISRSLGQLRDAIDEAGIQLRPQEKMNAPEPRPAVAPDPNPSPMAAQSTDEELFMEAVDGVRRTSWRHFTHPSSKTPSVVTSDPEVEGRQLMQAALDGSSPAATMDHPEYIEAWVRVSGKIFLPKLRNGIYSIQGQIDLHGLNRAEAQIAVENYIVRMSRYGSCCVKIIHGRGINSPADKATLKEHLQRFLSTRKMSRYVVAYASAPFNDGGVGAVYVLLSRLKIADSNTCRRKADY